MTEILSVDGTKIDRALSDLSKLIIRLNKSNEKSRKDKLLVKKITESDPRCGNKGQIEKECCCKGLMFKVNGLVGGG